MSNNRLEFADNWGSGKVTLASGEQVDAKGHISEFAEQVMDEPINKKLSKGDVRLLVEVHYKVNSKSHKGLVVGIYLRLNITLLFLYWLCITYLKGLCRVG